MSAQKPFSTFPLMHFSTFYLVRATFDPPSESSWSIWPRNTLMSKFSVRISLPSARFRTEVRGAVIAAQKWKIQVRHIRKLSRPTKRLLESSLNFWTTSRGPSRAVFNELRQPAFHYRLYTILHNGRYKKKTAASKISYKHPKWPPVGSESWANAVGAVMGHVTIFALLQLLMNFVYYMRYKCKIGLGQSYESSDSCFEVFVYQLGGVFVVEKFAPTHRILENGTPNA